MRAAEARHSIGGCPSPGRHFVAPVPLSWCVITLDVVALPQPARAGQGIGSPASIT
ncbi:hypothetical protein [Amycolatopsis sp. lyj-23]|uniref:hypothetical protein n=1 Tax=Amycolatopsis sp. lyj-23 TaxID=2789283 RepID=UPI00397A9C33